MLSIDGPTKLPGVTSCIMLSEKPYAILIRRPKLFRKSRNLFILRHQRRYVTLNRVTRRGKHVTSSSGDIQTYSVGTFEITFAKYLREFEDLIFVKIVFHNFRQIMGILKIFNLVNSVRKVWSLCVRINFKNFSSSIHLNHRSTFQKGILYSQTNFLITPQQEGSQFAIHKS